MSYFLIVKPKASLHPGPIYVKEGSNVTLPMCHVTGHPPPRVTWSRPLGKLPQSSVQSNHGNSSTLQLISVREDDSGRYICTASNPLGSTSRRTFLVVVRLPKFTNKPPANITVFTGDSLTLNCSAAGDPQPVISWKRLGAQLPVGRNQLSNGALTLKNMKEEDAGIYKCVATSAGVSDEIALSNIQVMRTAGKSIAPSPLMFVVRLSVGIKTIIITCTLLTNPSFINSTRWFALN